MTAEINTIDKLYKAMTEAAEKDPITKNRILVFGEGNKNSDIILIGEAPGGEEERLRRPFVGKAGQNLTEFLDTLELAREDIYITNVVKVRPTKISEKTGNPVNRQPNMEEIGFFINYLIREIKIINPKIIVTLGNFALKAVTNDANAKIGAMHGKLKKIGRYNIFPLYHPASIIYNQGLKSVYDNDLLKLKEYI